MRAVWAANSRSACRTSGRRLSRSAGMPSIPSCNTAAWGMGAVSGAGSTLEVVILKTF